MHCGKLLLPMSVQGQIRLLPAAQRDRPASDANLRDQEGNALPGRPKFPANREIYRETREILL